MSVVGLPSFHRDNTYQLQQLYFAVLDDQTDKIIELLTDLVTEGGD